MKPMPPCAWIDFSHASTAASLACDFAAAAARSTCSSFSATDQAAQYASDRDSSTATYASTSECEIA